MKSDAIFVDDLHKSYGKVKALAGVNLRVPYGSILGLLGPNGAGKTTLVRILTTLLKPDAGRALVDGNDVVRDAAKLRSSIGLAGQYAAVDANLTGQENLEMVGRLYHLKGNVASRRARELLEQFDLTAASGRLARTYSGGMRRRLDLAASLVARPRILFLDEPTAGLDPRSRTGLWQIIVELVREGTTVLLTTQYLEEADQLADQIVVVDLGTVIAEGTADELKSRSGGGILRLRVSDRNRTTNAAAAIAPFGTGSPQMEPETGEITLPIADGAFKLAEIVRHLDAAGVAISSIGVHQPTLDDVFLALTGRRTDAMDPIATLTENSRRHPMTSGRG